MPVIRKLEETGHQAPLSSTDYSSNTRQIAAHTFSRWCQENFFRYVIEHYHFEKLADVLQSNLRAIRSYH